MSTDSMRKPALIRRVHKNSIEETESGMFTDSIEKSALVRKASQRFNRRDRIRNIY